MTNVSDRSKTYRRWTALWVAVLAIGCVVGIAVPAGLGWDFANFYDAGRRVLAGDIPNLYDPLSLINGQPPQGRTGFVGTPISALLYVPMAVFPATTALVLFKIENVIAMGATFALLLSFNRPFLPNVAWARDQFTAWFAFLCLIYQPFWTVFRVGGQTTATVLLLLTAGLIAHTRGRLWGSALAVAAATVIKPGLAPLALCVGLLSGWPYLWRLGTLLAGAGALSLIIMGWPAHAGFLAFVDRVGTFNYVWYWNSSLSILAGNFREYAGPAAESGALGVIFMALTVILKAVAAGTIAWLVLAGRQRPWTDAARRHFHFMMAMVFYLLWSKTIWEHYLSFLFPLLIYIVAARVCFSRQALAIVAAIFVLSVGQNLVLVYWLRDTFAFATPWALLGIGLFKSGPLLLTLVLLWRHGRELLDSHGAAAWQHIPSQPEQVPR